MIFMNDTPKREVEIKSSTTPVNKPSKSNDGVTNEEQAMLLSGLFQFQDNNISDIEKNEFK